MIADIVCNREAHGSLHGLDGTAVSQKWTEKDRLGWIWRNINEIQKKRIGCEGGKMK